MSAPLLSVIIPYREDQPVIQPPRGNETLWMNSDLGIGEQRIKGSLEASHEWLVHVDADGYYPPDYLEKVREAIASGKYPYGFFCQRAGRFYPTYGEAGLVVRRDFFLERTKNFMPNHRLDISSLFYDLPREKNIIYEHRLTTSERNVLFLMGVVGVGSALVYVSMR